MNNSLHKLKDVLYKIIYFCIMMTFIASVTLASSQPTQTGSGNTVGSVVSDLNNGNGVYGTIREIMNILAWAGFAIAIFKLVQIGIMFLLSGGKSRSDAKTALLPWFVGALVCAMFGTIGPWFIDLLFGSDSGSIFDI